MSVPQPAPAASPRLFIVGLCMWIGGGIIGWVLLLVHIEALPVLWILLGIVLLVASFVGFVLAIVGLVLWLTRRSRVGRSA